MKTKKKLSFDDMKKLSNQDELKKIVGGILGGCHGNKYM